ncbi:hypothetical protein [Streptomyces syringium]|uniref:hypothetical protein n=1 Tax=Streptomyces syringium TaxID=76729 RepID=UPI0034403705
MAFEIRVICDEPDAPEITKRLADVFDISDVSRPCPTRHGDRVRLYIVAGQRQWITVTPPPTAAYADAPPIFEEMAGVLTLAMRLHRPGGYSPLADREYRLRKAALLDRVALSEGDPWAPEVAADADETAEAAAAAFAHADSTGDHDTGPTGPNAQCWAQSSYRGYVRQEYAAWRRYGHRPWHCTCDDFGTGPRPAHPNPDF